MVYSCLLIKMNLIQVKQIHLFKMNLFRVYLNKKRLIIFENIESYNSVYKNVIMMDIFIGLNF